MEFNEKLDWSEFEGRLARVLENLHQDQFLILAIKQSNFFVQFYCEGGEGIQMEATSNNYLDEASRLTPEQMQMLENLGWLAPEELPEAKNCALDIGSPNFHRRIECPVRGAEYAAITIKTLTEVFDATSPFTLEYRAYDESELSSFELSELGIDQSIERPEADSPEDDDLPDLAKALLKTLKEHTRVSTLRYNDEGIIQLTYDESRISVMPCDPSMIRLMSSHAINLTDSHRVLHWLNENNKNILFVRHVLIDGCIALICDIPAEPFVERHLIDVLSYFALTDKALSGFIEENLCPEAV